MTGQRRFRVPLPRILVERWGRLGGIATASFQTAIVTGIGAGISMLVQIALARQLDPEGYGTYLLTIAWLNLAMVVAKLELDTTSVRFVGSYSATSRWSLLQGYLRGTRRAVMVSSVVVALLAAAAVTLLSDVLAAKHLEFPAALLVACIGLPIVSLLMLEAAVLQGFKHYSDARLSLSLLRPAAIGVIVAVAWVSSWSLGAAGAVMANVAGAALALLAAVRWRLRAMPAAVLAATPEHDWKGWARTAYPLLAVSLAQVVISQQADIIVVGTMLDTTQVALYGAASQLTMPLAIAATSVTFVAQPMIAEMFSSQSPERLQGLIRSVTKSSIALTVPVAILLIVGGPLLLRLWGPEYPSGHPVLVILTISQLVVGVVGGLAGFMLTMTAHERQAAWIIGLGAVLNIVLAILLTPRFGAVGTASATLIAALTRAVVLSVYIRRTMGLRLPAI